MTISKRIKYLRKTLNLTQAEFANKIGLKQASIGLYENNNRNILDRTIRDICREFNVNEKWLREGIGDIFINNHSYLSINERLSLLREMLGLPTRKFGEKLKITGGAVTNMEKGTRNITDRTIQDICREFNVNESWLRYGNGEMFIENDGLLEKCLKENNATESDIKLIKCYLNLDLDIRNKIHKHFEGYFNNI